MKNIKALKEKLETNKITPKENIIKELKELNTPIIKDGISLLDLLKRPEISITDLKRFIELDYTTEEMDQVQIMTKYSGYIKKAEKEAEKLISLENKKIPTDIDYNIIPNLASEARQKLNEIKPLTIGQATRISGVNPADIAILTVYLKRNKSNE